MHTAAKLTAACTCRRLILSADVQMAGVEEATTTALKWLRAQNMLKWAGPHDETGWYSAFLCTVLLLAASDLCRHNLCLTVRAPLLDPQQASLLRDWQHERHLHVPVARTST